MMRSRRLDWEGCSNVRDLGDLATRDGRITGWGRFVRSDNPFKLSSTGWEVLVAHYIRTIITLRTAGQEEYEFDAQDLPSGIDRVSIAIEDLQDAGFIQKWVATELWCTPLYYLDALQRWPQRHAEVIAAFGRAQPVGVLIHCVRGNDRTGIITLLLLSLVGAAPEDIAADYALSTDAERDEILKERNTSSREVILSTVSSLDAEAYLLAAGLSSSLLDDVRERLLGTA